MRNSRERSLWNLRYPIFWLTLAASALAALTTVVVTQDRQTLLRWSVFLFANPQQGSTLFREKGCVRCHSVNGVGGKVGPDLAGAGGTLPISPFWSRRCGIMRRTCGSACGPTTSPTQR